MHGGTSKGEKKKEGGRKELTNSLSALPSPKKRPPSFELIFPSLCTSCFHLISSLSILLSLEDEPGKLMRVHSSFSPSLRFPSRLAFNSFVLCSSKPFSIHETATTRRRPQRRFLDAFSLDLCLLTLCSQSLPLCSPCSSSLVTSRFRACVSCLSKVSSPPLLLPLELSPFLGRLDYFADPIRVLLAFASSSLRWAWLKTRRRLSLSHRVRSLTRLPLPFPFPCAWIWNGLELSGDLRFQVVGSME